MNLRVDVAARRSHVSRLDRGRVSRVIVTGRIPDTAIEKLRAEHDVDAWRGPESIALEDLLRRVTGADEVVFLLTERVLDAAGP